MRRTTSLRLAITGAAAAALLASGGASGAVTAAASGTSSAGAADCEPGSAGPGALARVPDGSGAKEPKLYPDNEAKAYGALPDEPRLPDGSVTIETVFHSISDHALTAAEKARMQTMIEDQMDGPQRLLLRQDRAERRRHARSASSWPTSTGSSTRTGTPSSRARASAT